MEANCVALPVRALTALIFQCGLRINDARNINPQDVMPSGQIVVRQGKRSRTLVVTPANYVQFWCDYRHAKTNAFALYSYEHFRRLFIRYGLMIVTPAGKNNKVTHAGRTMLAREIYGATQDLAATAAALGHKSNRSTTYYLDDRTKRAIEQRGLLEAPHGQLAHLHVTRKGILYFREYAKKNQ